MSSLSFPALGSALLETLDVRQVEFAAANPSKLSTLTAARIGWARNIRESGGAVSKIRGLVILCDDTIALIEVGARGGFKKLWNFGGAA